MVSQTVGRQVLCYVQSHSLIDWALSVDGDMANVVDGLLDSGMCEHAVDACWELAIIVLDCMEAYRRTVEVTNFEII